MASRRSFSFFTEASAHDAEGSVVLALATSASDIGVVATEPRLKACSGLRRPLLTPQPVPRAITKIVHPGASASSFPDGAGPLTARRPSTRHPLRLVVEPVLSRT